MEFDLDLNHHIQRDIFRKLAFADSLRFSELKPKDIESNLFMYHLDRMIKDKFVQKVDGGYRLGSKGMWLADRISFEKLRFRVQAKVVLCLAIKSTISSDWLMMDRTHQPHFGAHVFPGGKLHYGERLADAARRELEEKSGLRGVDLVHRGDVSLIFGYGKTDHRHVFVHMFYGEAPADPSLRHVSRTGDTYWADPTSLPQDRFIPGYWEIRDLLDQPAGHFFAELEF